MSEPLRLSSNEELLLENLFNGVCLIDKEKRVVYWNEAAEQILGYTKEEVIGRRCDGEFFTRGVSGDTLCIDNCPLCAYKNDENADEKDEKFVPSTAMLKVKHKDGYRLPLQMRCLPIESREHPNVGAVKIFTVTFLRKAITMQLKKLGQFAYIDALTSIPNRRCMEDALHEWLTQCLRKNISFAVVMGDIDFFKNVNDKYGHDAGDLVLKKIADTLRKNLRTSDIVGRWGGEEFLILLHNIDITQLRHKLDLLKQAIEDCSVEYGDTSIKVTMSFGGAVPRKGDTMSSIVTRADDFLYISKREGRNRISIAEEEPEAGQEAESPGI